MRTTVGENSQLDGFLDEGKNLGIHLRLMTISLMLAKNICCLCCYYWNEIIPGNPVNTQLNLIIDTWKIWQCESQFPIAEFLKYENKIFKQTYAGAII